MILQIVHVSAIGRYSLWGHDGSPFLTTDVGT